ncbi:hypothetical protein [Edaphobacter modestus]|uniref:hypothetical protein n=1 Tax=Edaphobacter modestus TaxID=388466 RepID=UPI001F5F36CE|nr:hypothetical protein [Edaphobacter modestus]
MIGEVGIIAPVSRAFCDACSRVHLTSDGNIRACLFSQSDDLYGGTRRGGGSDADPAAFIQPTIKSKENRHHIGEPAFLKTSRNMVQIWRREQAVVMHSAFTIVMLLFSRRLVLASNK